MVASSTFESSVLLKEPFALLIVSLIVDFISSALDENFFSISFSAGKVSYGLVLFFSIRLSISSLAVSIVLNKLVK